MKPDPIMLVEPVLMAGQGSVSILPANIPGFMMYGKDGLVHLVGSIHHMRQFHTSLGAELVLASAALSKMLEAEPAADVAR